MAMQRGKFLEDYRRLKAVMGDEHAEAVSTFVSGQLDGNKEDLETTLATKTDIAFLKTDIGVLKTDISALELRLTERIAEMKSDTIKWVFIFTIGQISAISAIIFALFKHA